jgi:hypothetical protein
MFEVASRMCWAGALLLSALASASCQSAVAPADPSRSLVPQVDEHLARRRAVEHCRRLFKGLYMKGPRTGEPIAFPELEDDYFSVAEAQEHAWLLSSRRLAGWNIVARVAKQGDLVEITSWSFSSQ